MIIPYRTILVSPVNVSYLFPTIQLRGKKKLTENSSTNPHTRNTHANTTTESVNPALPSNVLDVVGDHLYRPIRLPITEACTLRIQASLLLLSTLEKLTMASPTPIVKIPVYISKREGLQAWYSVSKRPWLCPPKQQEISQLTPRTTPRPRTQSAGKNGSGWPSRYPWSPRIRS